MSLYDVFYFDKNENGVYTRKTIKVDLTDYDAIDDVENITIEIFNTILKECPDIDRVVSIVYMGDEEDEDEG